MNKSGFLMLRNQSQVQQNHSSNLLLVPLKLPPRMKAPTVEYWHFVHEAYGQLLVP